MSQQCVTHLFYDLISLLFISFIYLFYFVPYIPDKWTDEQPSNISLKFKITLLVGMHLTMNGRIC